MLFHSTNYVDFVQHMRNLHIRSILCGDRHCPNVSLLPTKYVPLSSASAMVPASSTPAASVATPAFGAPAGDNALTSPAAARQSCLYLSGGSGLVP